MVKRLKDSLKSLKIAKEAQNQMANELIDQLPEDKKKEAVALISKAKKGKMDMGELMNFSQGVRDINKKEFDRVVKEGMDRANNKKEEVSKEE